MRPAMPKYPKPKTVNKTRWTKEEVFYFINKIVLKLIYSNIN